MSTSGGYHEYIGGILIMSTSWVFSISGDTMSTSGGYHGGCLIHGGYHEHIGGIS